MVPGDWVVLRLPPDFVRRGQVVHVKGISMVVRWMGDDEDKVLPWAGPYIENGWLERVEAPAHAPQADAQGASGLVEVAQAAAMLGTTSKHVRAMLRSHKLTGRKEGHRWVGVHLTTQSINDFSVKKSRGATPAS